LSSQRLRVHQQPVGCNQVPGLEQHHVADHYFARSDLAQAPVAPHPDSRNGKPLQYGIRLLCSKCLMKTDYGVQPYEGHNDNGVDVVAQRC